MQPPRICTSCHELHVTTDWYVIDDFKHARRGEIECAQAHEDRLRREIRDTELGSRGRESKS